MVTESAYDTREPGTQRMLFTGPAGGAPQLVQLQLAALKGGAPAAESGEGVAAVTGRFCAREAYSQVCRPDMQAALAANEHKWCAVSAII